jgi:CarboxypepD_reg-like domain
LRAAFALSGFFVSIDQRGRAFIAKKPIIVSFQSNERHYVDRDEPETIAGSAQKAGLGSKIYEIGDKISAGGKSKCSIAGYVVDARTGEPISGASVYIEKPGIGTLTDQYGYYIFALPKERYTLTIQSGQIGMKLALLKK